MPKEAMPGRFWILLSEGQASDVNASISSSVMKITPILYICWDDKRRWYRQFLKYFQKQ